MSKVAIQGDSSGSGTFTIASPNSNNNRTLTLPDNTGTVLTTGSTGQVIPKAALPTGSVLQVVTASTSTQVLVSSSTFTDTGLSASITPTSASSKILVLTAIQGLYKSSQNSSNRVDLQLLRGATTLDGPGALLFTSGTALYLRTSFSHSYYDSPATTSATTYKWQFRNAEGVASVAVQLDSNSGASQIILMEIAA